MLDTTQAATGTAFRAALEAYRRRLEVVSLASAVLTASVVGALTVVTLVAAGVAPGQVRVGAVAAFAGIVFVAGMVWWRHWTLTTVAALVEKRGRSLDNLVITAAEVVGGRRGPVHPLLQEELFREAHARLGDVPPASVQPLTSPLIRAAAATIAAFLVLAFLPGSQPPVQSSEADGTPGDVNRSLMAGDLRVVITPPAYSGRQAVVAVNPREVVALEGSHIRLETPHEGGKVQLVAPGSEPMAFGLVSDLWTLEFGVDESRVLLIQRPEIPEREGADRLLHVRVDPDRRPLVRIRTPAKDLLFGEPQGQVPIEIEASDDIELASLALRFTRVAGSGEAFTFSEGEIPLAIQTSKGNDWRGQATLSLETLKLEDGDTLMYRAIATDRKPGADPAASEAFLIEIGRLAGVASTGFAVPEEHDRQGLSQQMLIIKTERLHAERSRLSRDAIAEQARLLAVEQRMVKAEFVFMTGGEVVDEVAEAEAGHELAEGRLENSAQLELLAAIREMSRAEARLNASDTQQGLVFEKAALRALQRAFDRRRYLLRTLPERARIDVTRRLTGDFRSARSSTRGPANPVTDRTAVSAREAMETLASAIRTRVGLNAVLAARVLAVDPASDMLDKIVVRLSSARDVSERVTAAREAQRHLAEILRAHLAASPAGRIANDPLTGRVADELSRPGGPR